MKKWFIVLLVIALAGLGAAGCGPGEAQPEAPQNQTEEQETEMTLTLYYGDREAMGLISEERTVILPPGKHPVQAAMEELGNEPEDPNAIVMLPAETKVLSVTVADGVVTINFNESFRTNFYGGSSSEALLINGIVNTVTDIEEFAGHQVRFLIEGQAVDSIGGHIDAGEPFSRQK